MGQRSPSRTTSVAKFRHLSANPEAVADFLLARHPAKTAEAVAAETGMSLAAARKLLERRAGCSFVNFVRLVGAYGPAFLVAVMPAVPDWLDEAARAEERRALQHEIESLKRRLERVA